MNSDYSKVPFTLPDDLETFTIQSGKDTLILREPIAADFLLIESLKSNPNAHERAFAMAERLAVSWNGQPGVTIQDIGKLRREGYRQLLDLTTKFFLDVFGDVAKEFISEYLSNQQSGV